MPTVNPQVSASLDDARYVSAEGGIYAPGSGSYRFGYSSAEGNCGSCFRVTLAVPQGSTINSSKITFPLTATGSDGTSCNIILSAADEDDASNPSSYTDAITRTRTSQTVSWSNIVAWGNFETRDSIDISPIIQEVVDRPGWVSGNHILIFIDNNGSSDGAFRNAYSYDEAAVDGAKLFVDYTESSGNIVQPVNQLYETDTNQSLARQKSKPVSQSSSSELLQQISRVKQKSLEYLTELNTAQTVFGSKQKSLGQASEVETSQAVARIKVKSINIVIESDTSLPFVIDGNIVVDINQNSEDDSIQPIGRIKIVYISQIEETDSVQTILSKKLVPIEQVIETDSVQTINRKKIILIGQANEVDAVLGISDFVNVMVGSISMFSVDYGITITETDYKILLTEET